MEDTPSALASSTGLPWLARVRAVEMLMLAITSAVAVVRHGVEPSMIPAGAVLVVGALSNLVLARKALQSERFTQAVVVAVLLLDTAALTWLLARSGGPANPFSTLYLVDLALAAMLLRPGGVLTVGLAGGAGYGFLFTVTDMASLHGPGAFEDHLRGMWLSFAASAVLMGGSLYAIRGALERKEEEVRLLRERAGRMDRLAALTALAAGAAHELGTPLGSIRLAARELEVALGGDARGAGFQEELKTIRVSVERCRDILAGLSRSGGQYAGEPLEELELASLWRRAGQMLPVGAEARVVASLPDGARVRAPSAATAEALKNILHNAVQASPDGLPVTLRATAVEQSWRLDVEDRGPGMPEWVRQRLGEPFVSTRPDGMGLGLYLATELCRQAGGRLEVEDLAGGGTRVGMVLPRA